MIEKPNLGQGHIYDDDDGTQKHRGFPKRALQLGSVSGLGVDCILVSLWSRSPGLHLLQSVKRLAILFIPRLPVGARQLAGDQEATPRPFEGEQR